MPLAQEINRPMQRVPETSPLRERIIYGLMSAFVIWHSIAITVGPAPRQSEIAQAISPLVDPYLNLIYLNVGWGFFAPVGFTSEIRLAIETSDGKTQTIAPTRNLPFHLPSTLWIKDRLRGVGQTIANEKTRPQVIADLCAEYQHMKPAKISMIEISQEKYVTPKDYLAGKRPLGEGFSEKRILGAGECPKV